ncbi:MAG: hypothetical protein Tsb009_38830 [Planctomycetaceae bacterium]
MQILDTLSDWFTAFTGGIERFITRLFGASNERQIAKFGYQRDKDGNVTITPGSILDQINKLEPEFEKLTDEELKQTASKFRARIAEGETLDDLLPEAFAAVRESSKRNLKMRHYDVQMVGGYFLHKGIIAEMVTGEGKTLVSTLPAFLNALTGHVHIVTVNDYLAVRDMEWMGPVHMALGLTVGAIEARMDSEERQKAYACDITYGTNNEFGFDYLRDNMKPARELQAQGELNFAIVDEIDNILIDEARTPLIISGPAYDDVTKYAKADRVARQLKKDEHFEVKEKEHTCHLTEEGVRKAEELAGVDSFFTAGNMEWPHLIDNSLRAHYLYKKDVNYVVENGEIVIVDEFTGRKMEGRQWSDGLHQAVEAKERVKIKEENQTLATITLQNFFKLYNKLAGMTGTAMTEASEFWKIYKLDVISVPTNRPLKRINYTDVIYRTEKEKWDAVIEEIREVHKTGRPILVGTVSIEKSEYLSNRLNKIGIPHAVLNAKYHEREAEIIAQAGRKSAVTIATNMAGRGTDIILGGNPEHMAWEELKQKYDSRLEVSKAEWDETTERIAEREGMKAEGREVAELGGLHVIGTERHDSRRIDLQLRGRAGRQGDPGSSRFFLSLEDDLMRLFAGEWVKNMLTRLGMKEGEAIESRMVMKRVEGAQKKVEERHFDQRKHLLEYDEVMDDQRKQVYSYRQNILDGANCRELITGMIEQQVTAGTEEYLSPDYRWETIAQWTAHELGVEIDVPTIRGMTLEQLTIFLKDEAVRQAEDLISEQIEVDLPENVDDEREWNWLALSKWANARWGLNTNDRELKKIGRDGLFDELRSRAVNAIERFDLSPLETMIADEFPRQAMCGWLNQQFTLEMSPEDFTGETAQEASELILEKVNELYEQKEVGFPVSVGMQKFLADKGSSERQGRELLIKWAGDRFGTELTVDDFKGKSRDDIESELKHASQQFRQSLNGNFDEKLEEYLDLAYGEELTGHQGSGTNGDTTVLANGSPPNPAGLNRLTDWVNTEFQAELDPEELLSLSRDDIRARILTEYSQRYRPELSQAERSLLLEILDTAWKDHLYYMDHLRSGIGLVGYAQKDPKTEYKREGRKAFNAMWDRIAQQVTSSIFRLEQESPDFVGSLWEITSTIHEDANIGADYGSAETSDMMEPGQDMPAIETIVNRGPKVGRNDPCPCGSGKKYKKCCGAN